MEKDRLHTVNDGEVERLVERWMSDECFNAVMSFFQAKSKLWAKLFFSGSREQTFSQQQIFSMNSAHDLWFHLHFQFAHKQKNLEISVKSFYASLKKFIDKLSHFLDMEWKFASCWFNTFNPSAAQKPVSLNSSWCLYVNSVKVPSTLCKIFRFNFTSIKTVCNDQMCFMQIFTLFQFTLKLVSQRTNRFINLIETSTWKFCFFYFLLKSMKKFAGKPGFL